MSPLLTLKEAAAELRVSKQWLQYWPVEHPVDAAGVPFYIPMGSRKKFEPADLDQIRSFMRDLALQLLFCFEVRALGGGLVSSTPE
jgi:hypothetical protein